MSREFLWSHFDQYPCRVPQAAGKRCELSPWRRIARSIAPIYGTISLILADSRPTFLSASLPAADNLEFSDGQLCDFLTQTNCCQVFDHKKTKKLLGARRMLKRLLSGDHSACINIDLIIAVQMITANLQDKIIRNVQDDFENSDEEK